MDYTIQNSNELHYYSTLMRKQYSLVNSPKDEEVIIKLVRGISGHSSGDSMSELSYHGVVNVKTNGQSTTSWKCVKDRNGDQFGKEISLVELKTIFYNKIQQDNGFVVGRFCDGIETVYVKLGINQLSPISFRTHERVYSEL